MSDDSTNPQDPSADAVAPPPAPEQASASEGAMPPLPTDAAVPDATIPPPPGEAPVPEGLVPPAPPETPVPDGLLTPPPADIPAADAVIPPPPPELVEPTTRSARRRPAILEEGRPSAVADDWTSRSIAPEVPETGAYRGFAAVIFILLVLLLVAAIAAGVYLATSVGLPFAMDGAAESAAASVLLLRG